MSSEVLGIPLGSLPKTNYTLLSQGEPDQLDPQPIQRRKQCGWTSRRAWRWLVPAALAIVVVVALIATGPHASIIGASPSESKPLVESNELRTFILHSELLAKAKTLEKFAYDTPERNRMIGTPGHDSTIKFIYDTVEQFPDYYDTYLQPYEVLLNVDANLTVNGIPLEVYSLFMSPPGKAVGPLVHIPNFGCDKSDFPADLTGKIPVILRGGCRGGCKIVHAGAANAAGAILYHDHPAPSTMDGKSLQIKSTPEEPYIPTGGITQADGLALVARLDAGEEIIGDLSTLTVNKTMYNVIAQTKGGDQNDVLQLGAHTDSVAPGPGINDNGSGTISLLEVAIGLTKFSVNNAVRFSWWTAEEPGLLGSTHYVAHLSQSEIDKIRLLLNFDMLASPNYAYRIHDGDGSAFNKPGPPGSAEVEHAFQSYFTNEAHQYWTEMEFDGRSDYGPFLDIGIACGGLATGDRGVKTDVEEKMFGGQAGVAYDINYHGVGDNVTNLDMGAWLENTKAIAHVVAVYARSFDSLPPKEVSLLAKRGAVEKRNQVQLCDMFDRL